MQNKYLSALLAAWLFFAPSMAAFAGTIFVDTGGLATNSGSTDANLPTTSGTAATVSGTTVTLDVSTNLGTVNTSGPNQTSINIAGTTNSNRTIFWIISVTSGCTGTAVACVVVVDTAPTGVTTNTWSVGGRYLWPSASTIDKAANALRPGDTLLFNNNPASRTAVYMTVTSSGDNTSGFVNLVGKSGGGRIVLNISNTAAVLTLSGPNIYATNLELQQAGASGTLLSSAGNGVVLDNIKINHTSGGGAGNGISASGSIRLVNSEVSGAGGACFTQSAGQLFIGNSYLHGCGGDGVVSSTTTPTGTIYKSIISNNSGSGINLSGTSTTSGAIFSVLESDVYSNTTAGLTVAVGWSAIVSINSIFQNNGSSANVNFATGNCNFTGYHEFNIFYASAGTNFTNCAASASDLTTNPAFNNAAGGDWSIPNSSPAAGAGVPGSIASSTGFQDMGAIQRQVTAGGGATGAIRLGIGQ